MRLKVLAVIALGAVGVGALIYTLSGATAGSADLPDYLTSEATIGTVTDDIAATGTIEAVTRTGLAFGVDPFLIDDGTPPASPSTYRVADVSVAVGDMVSAGDVLATAETTDLRRDLAAAKNDLLSARASMRGATSDLEAAEDDDVTAQIRQAKIGLYNAENQVAAAEDAVADLQARIAGATLTAPVAGLVTEVHVNAGFDAPSGAAAVIDSTTFEVTTDVVESDLTDVRVGQSAAISVGAIDADLTGTVTSIAAVASADSGSGVVSYPVTVTLSDALAALRSGMSADVTITIATAVDVLTVPSAALSGREGGYSVLVLGTDGTPVPTAVEVGLVTNTTAEIRSGLAEGTAVVTGTASDLLGTTGTGGFGGVAIPAGGGTFGGQLRPGQGPGAQP
jgi:RND family efflux transporter MFP subunit